MKTNVGVQRRSTSGLPIFDSLANAVSTVDNLLIGKLTGPDGTSLSFKSLNTRSAWKSVQFCDCEKDAERLLVVDFVRKRCFNRQCGIIYLLCETVKHNDAIRNLFTFIRRSQI